MGCISCKAICRSIVLGLDFEVGLGMGADGADHGGLLAHDDVAAVAAFPDGVAFLGEDQLVLDIGQELQITSLMLLLNFSMAATPSNSAAMVSKPSSRASLAKVAYISVHS